MDNVKWFLKIALALYKKYITLNKNYLPKNNKMFWRRKDGTQKQKAYDFYNSYKGEKVTWPTFYQRVRLWWDEPREERIKQKIKQSKDRRNAPRWKWAKELAWYETQLEPRASKCLFRNRLNGGYPKEEAILTGEEWLSVKREKKIYYPQVQKTYVPKPKVVKPVDERDYKIEITYSKEVAQIFRKEYNKMIEQLEWELTYTEGKTQIVELNSKLEQLKKERNIFNSYNPR